MTYDSFRVLIDCPAEQPSLGFDHLAAALAQIASESEPQFAIGVFGDWGSGKTTLMSAIQQRLDATPGIATVWFNAWRYEREEHLVIPLIDHLRARLQAAAEEEPGPDRNLFQKTAAALGRAGAALLNGLTVTAKVPGLDAKVDFQQVMKNLGTDEDVAQRVLSFYSASFGMIREALSEYHANGDRRIVVFVDDLDRCLPEHALEVLESMKLLFDLEGFVFVVGLNQSVIEQAVLTKYGTPAANGTEPKETLLGRDYIKKIFQVPFGLPTVSIEQLEEYFNHLVHYGKLPQDQREHLDIHVQPHLQYLSEDGTINPREIKRILNAYTLQLKMLAPRLGNDLNHEVIMTLQVLSFRTDWQRVYDKLVSDPELAQRLLSTAVEQDLSHMAVYGTAVPIPYDLRNYLKQSIAAPLLTVNLETYLSTAEATRSTDTRLVTLQAEIGTLRAQLEVVGSGNASEQDVSDLASKLDSFAHQLSSGPLRGNPNIEEAFKTVAKEFNNPSSDNRADVINRLRAAFDEVDDILFELRRRTSVVAAS